MRSAIEINEVFKNNFKRDIEIFKSWVLGRSIQEISEQAELKSLYVRRFVLRRAERAILFSNGLTWSDMPGSGEVTPNDYQKPEYKSFYLALIEKSLAVDLGGIYE